jgi:phosphopantothenoylcysteine decarboxylase/phosphopantothenate--cysteine ligase
VGFAAETHNTVAYARAKLQEKALDFIFANDVSDQAIGFDSELNGGLLISRERETPMDVTSKLVLAEAIVAELSQSLDAL